MCIGHGKKMRWIFELKKRKLLFCELDAFYFVYAESFQLLLGEFCCRGVVSKRISATTSISFAKKNNKFNIDKSHAMRTYSAYLCEFENAFVRSNERPLNVAMNGWKEFHGHHFFLTWNEAKIDWIAKNMFRLPQK